MSQTVSILRPRTGPRFTARIAAALALAFALVMGGAAIPAQAADGTLAATLTSGASGGGYLDNTQMSVTIQRLDNGEWVSEGTFFPGGLGLISVSRGPGTYRVMFLPPNGSPFAFGWYGNDDQFTFQESEAKQFVITDAGEFHTFDAAIPARGAIRTEMTDPTQPEGYPVPLSYQLKLWRLIEGEWVHWDGSYGLGGFGDINFAQFTNLPAGTYTISYTDQRVTPDRYVDQWYLGQPNQASATRIELGEFETKVLETVTFRTPAFSDIAPGQPFADEITWMQLQGISGGNAGPGGTVYYDAIASVTRQAMAAFLYRAAGSPEFTAPGTPSFVDVPLEHVFFKEIEWMKATGLTVGNADGTFAPLDPVSRQAMAAFLYRSAGSPTFTAPETPTFTDVPNGAPFYKEIEWVYATGISVGNADHTFGAVDDVTRQAMAAFLFRLAHLG